jgi:tRNA threonylcarbamoyladenosine biosynthesis protein TsaE
VAFARNALAMPVSSLPAPPGVCTEAELRAYGEALGESLRAPVVVALHGDLGAGKTTLAQAIARGAGVTGDVTSPTFALVHEYAGRHSPVYHIDLYRLERQEQLTNLGWTDVLTAHAIVLVEWPERAGADMPRPRIDVVLRDAAGDGERRSVEVAWTE